jgi:hypothetical protein
VHGAGEHEVLNRIPNKKRGEVLCHAVTVLRDAVPVVRCCPYAVSCLIRRACALMRGKYTTRTCRNNSPAAIRSMGPRLILSSSIPYVCVVREVRCGEANDSNNPNRAEAGSDINVLRTKIINNRKNIEINKKNSKINSANR